MLKIKIIAVGKMKEKYFKSACDEYKKRLSRFVKLEIVELPDEKAPESMSKAQIEQVKNKEGTRIISKIAASEYVVALALDAAEFTSEQWSEFFSSSMVEGKSNITFIIGGSNGLSDEVLCLANEKHSFSKFTFCHQLMRVILLEQVFRSMKILSGEQYHK